MLGDIELYLRNNILITSYFFISLLGYFFVLKPICSIVLFLCLLLLYKNEILIPKKTLYIFLCLSLWSFIVFIFSIQNLNGFDRFFSQQVKLFSILCEVLLGYFIARRFLIEDIVLYFCNSIGFFIIIGLYQIVAIKFDMPNWGLRFDKSSYAFDVDFGQRINSLIGEPKYFAILLSITIGFYAYKLMRHQINIFGVFFIISSFVCLFYTASGLGFFAAAFSIVFSVIYAMKDSTRNAKALVFVFSLFVVFCFFSYFYDGFLTRQSHKDLVDNFSTSLSFIFLLDDFVKLPLVAWIHHPFYLLSGFGFGLIHFFAIKYIYLADWFEPEFGYIDSNIGVISQISNFGVIITILYIISIFKLVSRLDVKNEIKLFVFLVTLNPFVFGALDFIPSFFFFGIILWSGNLNGNKFLNVI